MNKEIDEIKRFEEILRYLIVLSDEDRKFLNDYILANSDAYDKDPIGTTELGLKCLTEKSENNDTQKSKH